MKRFFIIALCLWIAQPQQTCLDFKYPVIFGDDTGDSIFTTLAEIDTHLYVGGYSTTKGVQIYLNEVSTGIVVKYTAGRKYGWTRRFMGNSANNGKNNFNKVE